MSLEKVCSNTAPLWHLGRIKKKFPKVKSLELIKEVYSQIYVPAVVPSELGIKFKEDGVIFIGNRVPQTARDYVLNETIVMEVKDTLHVERLLQQYMPGKKKAHGECETLALAKELNIAECLLANDGAERMFDNEEWPYRNIIPFADFCFHQGIINEAEAYAYLDALWKIGYKEDKYLSIFEKYGIRD